MYNFKVLFSTGVKVVKNSTDLKGERFVADNLATQEECETLENLVLVRSYYLMLVKQYLCEHFLKYIIKYVIPCYYKFIRGKRKKHVNNLHFFSYFVTIKFSKNV